MYCSFSNDHNFVALISLYPAKINTLLNMKDVSLVRYAAPNQSSVVMSGIYFHDCASDNVHILGSIKLL